MSDPHARGGRLRVGCAVAAVLTGAILLAAGVSVAIALRQIRTEKPELRAVEQPLSGARPVRVVLDVAVARVVIGPAPAGAPLGVAASYDRGLYRLEASPAAAGSTYRIAFGPAGSETLALLRVKLGADPPLLRIELPRDVPLELEGSIRGSYAAVELGGLRLESSEFGVTGGALSMSFGEPLAAPMDRLTLRGDRGSLEVTGLGNASPRRFGLRQHLGAVDLDLRGAWRTDSVLSIRTGLAGGSVWLPRDVRVEGLDDRIVAPGGREEAGTARPRLRFSVTSHAGRLVFVE